MRNMYLCVKKKKTKDAAADDGLLLDISFGMLVQSTESEFSFFSFLFRCRHSVHWWQYYYIYFVAIRFFLSLTSASFLLHFYRLIILYFACACIHFVLSMHTIDYCSLLSNRRIRFHQFFRSFDYSMKFQFLHLFRLVVVGFVLHHIFYIKKYMCSVFLFACLCPSLRTRVLLIFISMLQLNNNKSLEKRGKNQRKISHFNVEI